MLEIVHVAGSVEDADFTVALLDLLIEDLHGVFVPCADNDGALAFGVLVIDTGEHAFHLVHLATHHHFEGVGAVRVHEGEEEAERADWGCFAVIDAGLFLEHEFDHESQEAFVPFGLQAVERIGVEVSVDEVFGGVIDGIELELEL